MPEEQPGLLEDAMELALKYPIAGIALAICFSGIAAVFQWLAPNLGGIPGIGKILAICFWSLAGATLLACVFGFAHQFIRKLLGDERGENDKP